MAADITDLSMKIDQHSVVQSELLKMQQQLALQQREKFELQKTQTRMLTDIIKQQATTALAVKTSPSSLDTKRTRQTLLQLTHESTLQTSVL